LTEEEKRTFKQENLEIPTQLPLSKAQEKILKKIRRKIKNKVSYPQGNINHPWKINHHYHDI
jgi:hypothetical protein